MDADQTLNACLERLAEGDLAVRDRILEICEDRLRALAHRMLGRFPGVRRFDDTDDVFQGAALRLHRALGQMALERQSPRSLMALAATQIHRELIDLARRNSGPTSYAANHGTNAGRGSESGRFFVDAAAAEDEPLDRWERFHAAVDALHPRQKETFHLVWYMGADQKTIARLLGCSERTVKNHWREARDAVKAALDGEAPR
jgi:RNA polymerase sigma factor (sigma-70 family)